MDSIFSMSLEKEHSSCKDEQETLNENHLVISIHFPKRLRDLVDPFLKKSEPKGYCHCLLNGSSTRGDCMANGLFSQSLCFLYSQSELS